MNTPARLRGRRGGADVGAIRERLVRALRIGDRAGIRAELCLDVTLVVDSGGQVPVPPGVADGSDAVAGVLLGLGAAFWASRAIRSVVPEASAIDPLTFVSAPVLLLVAALVACYIPARRAARISPVNALSR